jgi:hypothetical protein
MKLSNPGKNNLQNLTISEINNTINPYVKEIEIILNNNNNS